MKGVEREEKERKGKEKERKGRCRDLAALDLLGAHDHDVRLFLPDHAPEILHRVRQTSLRRYVHFVRQAWHTRSTNLLHYILHLCKPLHI